MSESRPNTPASVAYVQFTQSWKRFVRIRLSDIIRSGSDDYSVIETERGFLDPCPNKSQSSHNATPQQTHFSTLDAFLNTFAKSDNQMDFKNEQGDDSSIQMYYHSGADNSNTRDGKTLLRPIGIAVHQHDITESDDVMMKKPDSDRYVFLWWSLEMVQLNQMYWLEKWLSEDDNHASHSRKMSIDDESTQSINPLHDPMLQDDNMKNEDESRFYIPKQVLVGNTSQFIPIGRLTNCLFL